MDEELEKATGPMERGSPVTSRAQESREPEGSGDDEPGVDARPTVDAAEARADLARHLQPSVFPASRDRLLDSAREMEAPQGILELLEGLPGDRELANVQEVWEALGLPEPEG